MDIVISEGVQLGAPRPDGVTYLFEKTLVAITRMLGRPLPELRGGMITGSALDGQWFAEVCIRAPMAYPDAEEYTFQTVDRSWVDAANRILQESIARMAHIDDYFFIGSRFELLGRRDADGVPVFVDFDDDSTLGPHIDEMERLLHSTQTTLDTARGTLHQAIQDNRFLATEAVRLASEKVTLASQRASYARQLVDTRVERDAAIAQVQVLKGQLETTCLGHHRLSRKVESLEITTTTLRDRLRVARADLAARDAVLDDLQEEVADLREENDDLLTIGVVPSGTDTDGMDMSEPSDQEDDDARVSDEDPEEILSASSSD